MARSSSPFSSPFSKKEGEDKKRNTKQARFFKPEPETSRFKLEKLWELPKKDTPTFSTSHDNLSHEVAFNVQAISDTDQILESEVLRVRWYLDKYDRYKSLGYDSIIKFPTGINPNDAATITNDAIRASISKEFTDNSEDYEAYAKELESVWLAMSEVTLPIAAQVYGFAPTGNFILVPTAYGTGGGSLVNNGIVFMKLPKYRPRQRRTEIEAITHEILCHEATALIRTDTLINDSIFATYQWHKERLMDLLGRTILVRSQLMNRNNIVMDDYAESQAASDIDPLYYSDPKNPDENSLRYEGALRDLVGTIELNLK